jgi:predicted flap endonuclease-1-like 5' DNA nuclease
MFGWIGLVTFVVGVLVGWLLKGFMGRGQEAGAAPAVGTASAPHLADVAVTPDDLTRIEGIGPQIAELLNTAGIQTFAQLADTSAEKLTAILHEAGPRFQIARPGSWPAQARLAAAGEWSALERLQNELKGGV